MTPAEKYEPILDDDGEPTGYHRDLSNGEIVTLPDEYDEFDDVEVTPEQIAADNAAAGFPHPDSETQG